MLVKKNGGCLGSGRIGAKEEWLKGTSFQIERVHLNTAGVFAWAFITVILAAVLEASIGLIKFKRADQG